MGQFVWEDLQKCNQRVSKEVVQFIRCYWALDINEIIDSSEMNGYLQIFCRCHGWEGRKTCWASLSQFQFRNVTRENTLRNLYTREILYGKRINKFIFQEEKFYDDFKPFNFIFSGRVMYTNKGNHWKCEFPQSRLNRPLYILQYFKN